MKNRIAPHLNQQNRLNAAPGPYRPRRVELPPFRGGQGRISQEVAEQARISTEGALVVAMTAGVVALIVACGWIVEVLS
jgi:hypothetical protein